MKLFIRCHSISRSGSRWHEISGSNEHKDKSDKWLQDAPTVHGNLPSAPTPKVANLQASGTHTRRQMLKHAYAKQQHFLKPCHRKLQRKGKIRQARKHCRLSATPSAWAARSCQPGGGFLCCILSRCRSGPYMLVWHLAQASWAVTSMPWQLQAI